MLVSPATIAALDRITARATDVRKAFTPGAFPQSDDVASNGNPNRFSADPLSVAAPPGEYFLTTDDRGRTAYTRDGAMNIQQGVLRGPGGQPVLGYVGASRTPGQIALDPIDVALGRIRGAQIERDGSLSYQREAIDPRTGARELHRVVVGRIALARFPAATKLTPIDAWRAAAPSQSVPHVGCPGDANFGPLEPHRQTASGIDIDRAIARLKDAYVAFDALAAGQTASYQLGKTVLDLVK